MAKQITVKDIEDLLLSNGASYDVKAQIRLIKYETLFPNKQTINKLKKLGQGAGGSVYVIDIDGLSYALKIMGQKRGETQQQLIENFYNECKALLSVNHQRVLRLIGVVIDTSQEGDYCFCHYTNYQQKGNLFDVIRSNQLFSGVPKGSPLRILQKLKLLSQISEGIHAIHAVGLIHRDIKSLNILLDENDTPKIADLGLAGDTNIQSTQKARGTYQ